MAATLVSQELERLGLEQGKGYWFHTLDGFSIEGELVGIGVRFSDMKIETVRINHVGLLGEVTLRWDAIRMFRKAKEEVATQAPSAVRLRALDSYKDENFTPGIITNEEL
jgi:hypothetical protein